METIVARGDDFAVGQAIGRRGGQATRDAAFHTARAFPRHLRELEGIAHGAGPPLDEIFLWNCRLNSSA
jgi:hypothetical protein